jgi:LPS sulfotransferase NodH
MERKENYGPDILRQRLQQLTDASVDGTIHLEQAIPIARVFVLRPEKVTSSVSLSEDRQKKVPVSLT